MQAEINKLLDAELNADEINKITNDNLETEPPIEIDKSHKFSLNVKNKTPKQFSIVHFN